MTTSSTSDHAHAGKHVALAIFAVCVGYLLFNIGDAGIKVIAQKFHFSQIFLIQSVLIIAFMSVYGIKKDGIKKTFQTKKPRLMFWRAALAQVVALTNIIALPHIHLTTFYTLIFTSPLWVAVLSVLFLNDKLEKRKLAVILGGFAVILFIFRPGGGLFDTWSLLVLANAFLYSCQMIIVRKIGPEESRPHMIMWGSVMSFFIAMPFIGSHWITPDFYEWALFLMMSMTGSIGLLCIMYAFQHAPSAATVAPYHYTQIIWGALIGYFFFNEVPNTQTLIGAAVIIIAGLYLVHQETRRPVLKISGV